MCINNSHTVYVRQIADLDLNQSQTKYNPTISDNIFGSVSLTNLQPVTLQKKALCVQLED